MVMWPGPSLASSPCRTAFSTSGCRLRNGITVLSTSGAIRRLTWTPVAEPGALQQQVAVDAAQFLGQGGEVAVPAEGIAGEVGELDHQLPGARRVGVDEGRDRVQRVVDEVRADLGAEGPDLGLHQQGSRGVQLGQLHLRGHPVGHFAGGPDQPGAGGRGEGRHDAHHARARP